MCISVSTVGIATPQHQKFFLRLRDEFISFTGRFMLLWNLMSLFLTKIMNCSNCA